jgi:hypothetical protein
MISKTTERFWKCYAEIPLTVRKQAKEAYKQFLKNPYYPSLHFKQIHSTRPIFSVRITINYRAIGIMQGEEIIWFWIGSHADYNNLLKQFRHA